MRLSVLLTSFVPSLPNLKKTTLRKTKVTIKITMIIVLNKSNSSLFFGHSIMQFSVTVTFVLFLSISGFQFRSINGP